MWEGVETKFHQKYDKSKQRTKEHHSKCPVLQPEESTEKILHTIGKPLHPQVHGVLIRPTKPTTRVIEYGLPFRGGGMAA